MMHPPDLLEEYQPAASGKSQGFVVLIILFFVYMLFMSFELIYHGFPSSPGDSSVKPVLLIIALIIPFIGTLLFMFKKKAGWIICALFFSFLASCMYIPTLLKLVREKIFYSWEISFLMLLSTLILLLLFSKRICALFRLSRWLLVFIFLAGLLMFCALFQGMQNDF
jgi:hypothetical protein